MHYLACIRNVGAGIATLMSMPDGLGPSIFSQKIRPMGEEMDGKVVYFPPEENQIIPILIY